MVRPAAALVNELRFTNVLIMVGMVAKEWVSVNRQVHGGWPSNSFVVDWNSGTTTYEYDPAGRLITTALPKGMQSVSSYDDANRLVELTHTAVDSSLMASFTTSWTASATASPPQL